MIGHKQLRAVEDFLKKNENKAAPKILYLHHIPHEPAKDYWMDLLDWEELIDVATGQVNLLAYGHSGRMPDPKDADLKAKVTSARDMKVRTAQREGFEYILDANDSVEDQSCYRITIENNALHRPVKEMLKK